MNIVLGFLKGPGIWIFVALAAAGWWRAQIKAAEARGEAAILVQQADSLRRAFQADSLVWARRDSAAQANVERLGGRVDSLTGVLWVSRNLARRERRRADSTITTLADTAAAAVILGALDAITEETVTCGFALVACDSTRQAQAAIIVDVRGRLSQADGVIVSQGTALERLKDLAGRGGGIDLLHIGEGLAIVLLAVLNFTK